MAKDVMIQLGEAPIGDNMEGMDPTVVPDPDRPLLELPEVFARKTPKIRNGHADLVRAKDWWRATEWRLEGIAT